MAEPLLLEVKNLNIEFHDHLIPETVVCDFDLELKAGEIVGLVGIRLRQVHECPCDCRTAKPQGHA